MGYPLLQNVALPRVGAMETILETLTIKSSSNSSTVDNPVTTGKEIFNYGFRTNSVSINHNRAYIHTYIHT